MTNCKKKKKKKKNGENTCFYSQAKVFMISLLNGDTAVTDIGKNVIVLDDFTEKELQTEMWWRHLVAGGATGAVSRTCTAPLDHLKNVC